MAVEGLSEGAVTVKLPVTAVCPERVSWLWSVVAWVLDLDTQLMSDHKSRGPPALTAEGLCHRDKREHLSRHPALDDSLRRSTDSRSARCVLCWLTCAVRTADDGAVEPVRADSVKSVDELKAAQRPLPCSKCGGWLVHKSCARQVFRYASGDDEGEEVDERPLP